MAELLLELFSEEIPASAQAKAADDLASLLTTALDGLNPAHSQTFHSARRIAVVMDIASEIPSRIQSERGPRETAPAQALAGFTRKHGVSTDDLVRENGFWVLNRTLPPVSARTRIADVLPDLLWKFPWSKSMRWGEGSGFVWIRPLRRILCLLDGDTVPFTLARSQDDGHGLHSGAQTEGHRILAPGAVTVTSTQDWLDTLTQRFVIMNAEKRRAIIRDGIATLADAHGLVVVPDEGLIDEVAGLVEYPVPLLGRIDDAYMTLPAEVMQVSMRINQRYFTLRTPDGHAAPFFAFVANLPFADDGKLVIVGNERVLRARFADARHFWDLDRKTRLSERVAALDAVTFHAKLGTQGERARRLAVLAGTIARALGLGDAEIAQAERAALLAKADLSTGMVGEFPELQGIMGGYYATHDGEHAAIARAIADHYLPRGPSDTVARTPVAIAVALADRLDLLVGFFVLGETPTGSGDPYGLRRAALGVIRTIRDNNLRIDLLALIDAAAAGRQGGALAALPAFIADRLRVQLRSEGARHDVLAAILASGGLTHGGPEAKTATQTPALKSPGGSPIKTPDAARSPKLDGDLVRLLARTEALSTMIQSPDGINLLAAAKRAANILRIENRKDGPHTGAPDPALYEQDEEKALAEALHTAVNATQAALDREHYTQAMQAIAGLRPVLDRFFEAVVVNADKPALRRNRLYLLEKFCATTGLIADFGQIEG